MVCAQMTSHILINKQKLADFQNDIYDACKPVNTNVLQ